MSGLPGRMNGSTIFVTIFLSKLNWCTIYRASDISREKKQNFAGFSGANSRKNRPISRDFRGKKVKIRSKIGRFRGIFAGESQNSQKNRPISQDFSGKKSNFEGFLGQILRKIGRFHGKFGGETSPRNNQ